MASSTTIRPPCAKCGNKSVGIFKCEGCSQIFCRKHVNEHRDMLSHQLDEIVLQHDILQQTIIDQNDGKNIQHSLLKQIDQWEKDSILKIQQTAEEARQQLQQITNFKKGKVSKELYELTERLQKARIDDDFIETDLQQCSTILEKLKNDINTISPSITISEDSTKLIGRLNVSKPTEYIIEEERFGESFGDIRIEDNGQMIIHSDSNTGDAFVRGTCEYSSGKHKIRFVVRRKNSGYYFSFGIISKLTVIPQYETEVEDSTYGWQNNDNTIPRTSNELVSHDFRDMRDQTTFEIELLLDCDNRKISYFNQQTGNTRKMNVDISICPFPWQLLFYLFDVDDCIQLIPSKQQL